MSARLTSFWYRTAETAFLLLALLLPLAFYLKTYDSAMIKTTLFQAGVLVLLFAWLFKGLERGRWELPAAAKPLLAPAAALAVWALLRFLTAPYKLASLQGFLQQELCLAVYAVAVLEFGGFAFAARLSDWLLGAAWASCVYGLIQRLGLDPFVWKGAFGERVFSTLANPDLYGSFLALCLPVILAKLLDPERDSYLRTADLCLLALVAANIVWTGSAESLAAFVLMSLVSAVVLPAFIPSRAAAKTAALAAAAGLAVFAAALTFRGKAFEENFADRVEFKRHTWAGTLRMLAERPLSGQGPGSFSVHYPRFRPPEIIRLEGRHNTETDHPDSQLLEIAAELGAVGAALWAWLFGALLAAAWKARRAFIHQGALGESCYLAGLFAATTGFLIASQLGLGTWLLVPGWLLWPLGGLLGGLTLLARRGGTIFVLPLPVGEAGRRKAYAPALLALAALAVYPALWFRSDIEHNIAIYYAKQRDWEQALAHYRSVTPGAPSYVMAQYFMGNVLSDSGRAEEALAQYAKVEALAPDYVQLHYQQGVAYAALGSWSKAMESHARQARLDPLFVENYSRWSAAALAAGETEEARRAAYRAIALSPKDPGLWTALSNVYIKERRLAAARRLQREAARLRRERPAAPDPG